MMPERETIKGFAKLVGIFAGAGALMSLTDPRVPLWFGAVSGAGLGLLVLAVGGLTLLGSERWRKSR